MIGSCTIHQLMLSRRLLRGVSLFFTMISKGWSRTFGAGVCYFSRCYSYYPICVDLCKYYCLVYGIYIPFLGQMF